MACLIAPSLAVLTDVKVKETKIAKLFDMEEEDTRDSDSETEKETHTSEKIFNNYFSFIVIPEFVNTLLVHYYFYLRFLAESFQELVTPPPQGYLLCK